MQSGSQGRNRVKSVSFRGEPEVNNAIETKQRSSFRDHEELNQRELDESRMVKLLPDANMTISVHNDYRDLRLRGGRSILKSNSFRDDTNLNYNNERNNQHSNRGFETFRGRSRGGRPRGFYHGNNNFSGNYYQEYDNFKDSSPRNYRGRPLSGNYEKGPDYNHRGYRGRQTSESHENDYDSKMQPDNVHSGHTSNRGRQATNRNHDNQEQLFNKDQQSGQAPNRGRSKSANDRHRPYRGRGKGRGGSGKTNNNNSHNDTDGPVTGEGDNVTTEEKNVVEDTECKVGDEAGHIESNCDITEPCDPPSVNTETDANSAINNSHDNESESPVIPSVTTDGDHCQPEIVSQDPVTDEHQEEEPVTTPVEADSATIAAPDGTDAGQQ